MRRSHTTPSPGSPARSVCRARATTPGGHRKPSAHSLADAALKERIEAIHESSRGVYGAPRVHAELALGHGMHVGRKRVARLMREANLAGASR
jgi:transposase InsO family protein